MKSIVYNGKKYGRRHVINNIKREYLSVKNPAKNFYTNAAHFARSLEGISGITFKQVAGVIAALSPLKSWSQNKRLTIDAVFGNKIGHTKLQTGKAKAILSSFYPTTADIEGILSGTKTINFFLNIIDEKDAITIDRHAVNLALNRFVYSGLHNNAYTFFQQCYMKAAEELGVKPHELQSATWTSWRNKHQYRRT